MREIKYVLTIVGWLGIALVLMLLVRRGAAIYNQSMERSNETEVVVINSLLSPYVLEYKAILEEGGVDIPWGKDLVRVTFGVELPQQVLGVAWGMDVDNITLVEINFGNWLQLTHEKRRLLIFHELTHDIYNIEHFDISLMNTPMPENVTKLKVDTWMQELVKHLK